jgi:hypothetical protein
MVTSDTRSPSQGPSQGQSHGARHILKHLPILLRVRVWQTRPGMRSERTGNDRKPEPKIKKKDRQKLLEKQQLVGSIYIPQMLYIWKIYLHLGHFWGKCRKIFHTWSIWDLFSIYNTDINLCKMISSNMV